MNLIEKYPKLFSKAEGDKYPISLFNIECYEGWHPLIDKLCSSLQFDIDNNKQPQIVVHQVKEKFGGLRFYTDTCSERQYGMISFAESLSYHFCELCGIFSPTPLTKNIKGWVVTHCDKCNNK